ncbi:MAG: ATPase, T2SS/T4P/T4SS family [Acidobacteriota bacterium]
MSSSAHTPSEEKPPADGGVQFKLSLEVDSDLIKSFPKQVAQDFGVVPLGQFGSKTLLLAADRELSSKQLKELRQILGKRIHIVPSPGSDLAGVLAGVFDGSKVEEAVDQAADSVREGTPAEGPETAPAEPSEAVELRHQELIDYADRSHYEADPKPISAILVDLEFVSQEDLEKFLTEQQDQGKEGFDPSSFIDPQILRLVSEELAQKHTVLPLLEIEGDLLVAAGVYLDAQVVAELRQSTGLMPKIVIAEPESLGVAIRECYERRQYLKAEEMTLGEYLMAHGFIEREQLDTCLELQKNSNEKLGALLVQQGYVAEDTIYIYLAEKLGYEHRRFSTADLELELSKLVSQRFAERNLVLPLAVDYETKELEVAMAEPYDLKVIDTLNNLMGHHGYQLKPVLSSPANIKEGIAYLYNFQGIVEDQVEMETIDMDAELDRKDLVATEDMPKVRRVINQVLYRAVVEGASDIHIENLENRIRVRFRMDGLLQERKTSITKDLVRSVISVFKVDSSLDITEHRRSQDGVFKMSIGQDRFVDFRINLHSTDFGQDAVIRILDTSKNLLPLDGLGCPPKMLSQYLMLIENPQGLILFTGPTGSGKSTTLYSTLAHLNSPEKKIVTAEDPVEYYLDGICQYKVNEAIGNTFDEYARRFLRKDPDIILIGEIRDERTAQACFRAAMTGHLVFSTLHANDSVGAILRLRNLGVESAIAAEALLAVVSQRLARRTCSKCRQPYEPDPALISLFYPEGPGDGVEFMTGVGCAVCDYLGYKGRLGLYEYWELTPEMLLAIGGETLDVREKARRSGLMSLVTDGLTKVEKGLTTLEELRRVVPLEQVRATIEYEMKKKNQEGEADLA